MPENVLATCKQSAHEVIDNYFLEHRAKLIDIAAFLDRIDRSGLPMPMDFRHEAFVAALNILLSEKPFRAKRILELFSVMDGEIPETANGLKGASGAAPPTSRGNA